MDIGSIGSILVQVLQFLNIWKYILRGSCEDPAPVASYGGKTKVKPGLRR